jgi:hypothetical protein
LKASVDDWLYDGFKIGDKSDDIYGLNIVYIESSETRMVRIRL